MHGKTAEFQVQKALLVGAFPLMAAVAIPQAAQAFSFSSIYVFGDSLSDSGNAYQQTFNLIPPAPPYVNGRFSNGPVWVEYLAPQLGLRPEPTTNFAFGGATTGTLNTIPGATFFGLPGIQTQVSQFVQTTPTADPNALYIVFGGANDYLGGNQLNPAIPVGNLATAIQSLAGVGARNFLVPNLADLGQLAGTQGTPNSPGLTALTNGHNALLAQTLSVLGQTLGPSVNLIPLDLNWLVNDALANPGNYGFTNVTNSCVFPPPLLAPPGSTFTICGSPDQYLWWDDIHPTTAAHRQISTYAFGTIQSAAIPEPSTTLGVLVFSSFLGAAVRKRKQQSKGAIALTKITTRQS